MKKIKLIDHKSGLLTDARQCPSPNFDSRPPRGRLSLIVIHNISLPPGEFGGKAIDQLFTNCLDPKEHDFYAGINHLRVASHLLIRRTGEVVQYVPFHQRAFHAGVSTFQGQERCNDFSIGIELEGSDHVAFTDEQYIELIQVIKILCESYDELSYSRITGHQHIAPERKTDPGPFFDWGRLSAAFEVDLPTPAD